ARNLSSIFRSVKLRGRQTSKLLGDRFFVGSAESLNAPEGPARMAPPCTIQITAIQVSEIRRHDNSNQLRDRPAFVQNWNRPLGGVVELVAVIDAEHMVHRRQHVLRSGG